MSDVYKCGILIVDDEQANILLLTKILNIHGYTNVSHTTDSEEVVNIMSTNKIALVLMDINMPFMNGYEVLEKIRNSQELKNTPVIAISGDVSSDDVNAAIEAGFINYVTKPINMKKLIKVISDTIE